MNKTLITIVALSVDTRHAVLYKHDGSTLTIPQGDARLPKIVADARIPLAEGMPALVDVTPIVVQRTEFVDAEKGTGGVVKFFRVAKSFLKKLVNTESPDAVPVEVAHVSPLDIGVFPGRDVPNQGAREENEVPQAVVPDAAEVAFDQAHQARGEAGYATTRQIQSALTNDQKIERAQVRLQQLVSNSKTTVDPEFHKPLDEKTETIVAVHQTTGAIIPDAHKLARQLRSSQKLENYVGFTKFIERLADIIDQRGHSVEDLMKFIEHGDLPIADDGCIVIYKRLKRRQGHFVDVHSGNVRQKVGSFVYMRSELVDPNRRKDCSNGLHVATLGYIGGFSGDVTIMGKVRPEDVFAVPEYDFTKMRVAGYHVLVDLPEKLRVLVNGGGSISSDPDGAILLNNVLRGHHIGITQYVQIGGHEGTNITYTDVEGATGPQVEAKPADVALSKAETLDMQEALEAKAPVAPDVKATDLVQPDESSIKTIMSTDPKETSQGEVDKTQTAKSETKLSQKDKAQQLLSAFQGAMSFPAEQKAAQALVAFRKSTRKGWAVLGISAEDAQDVEKTFNCEAAPVNEPKAQAPVKSTPVAAVQATDGQWEKAKKLLKAGKANSEVASKTGLSKDQVYRLKKKLQI
jgi:hypothetical protein